MENTQSAQDNADLDLLAACGQGKRDAQQMLYRKYYGELMAVCLRYINAEEEAAEVVNDAFMKIFEGLKREIPQMFRAWARRIAVNTAIDHFRANKKHYYAMDIEHTKIEATAESAIEKLSAREIIDLVASLPDSYRTVFNLYVIEGYDHKEIATMLDITDGTSRSHLAKARVKLQKLIQNQTPQHYNNGYVG